MPFLLAFGLALFLTPLAGRLGVVVGLVDRAGDDGLKIHGGMIPVLGGVGLIAASFLSLAILGQWPDWGVWAGVVVALAGGLVDDARPLPPVARVLLLVGAGALLLVGTSFEAAGLEAAVGVVALVLACANAVNITDGQDGLAGGLGALSALGLAALSAVHDDGSSVALGLALAGGLGAFLLWNRPPARIFLGNGGAYAVGTLLAYLAARLVALDGWRGLLAAGACLGPFAFELVFTVARRALSRDRLGLGDRLHSYDLVASRVGRAASSVAFWVLGLGASGLGLLVGSIPIGAGAPLAIAVALGAALWGVRLWQGRMVPT
jgi:UDP-GlcNAc:undecaprenyl-phosphate GlcNAc-1-phosphate transferase